MRSISNAAGRRRIWTATIAAAATIAATMVASTAATAAPPAPAAAQAEPEGPFKAVAAGNYVACAIRDDDSVTCWGDDEHGWGDDENGQASAPGGTFEAISASGDRTCGLRADGTPDCWGDSHDWQKPRDWNNPLGTYEAIAAGRRVHLRP